MTEEELRAENVMLKTALEKAIEIIDNLICDTPCRLDHHGFCQEHYYFDEVCWNKAGVDFLALVKSEVKT